MPVPAPGADEDATPIYGIRKPKSIQKAKWIWRAISRIADDVETVLGIFGLPPVVSSNTVIAASSAARDAHWGTPATAAARLALQALGANTIRTDKGWTERYFAAIDDGGVGTNPAGTTVAGWYPVTGKLPYARRSKSAAFAWATAAAKVDFNTAVITDAGLAWDAVNFRFTVSQAGYYDITAKVAISNAAIGVSLDIYVNGVLVSDQTTFGAAANFTSITLIDRLKLAAGDQVDFRGIASAANAGWANAAANFCHIAYKQPA